MHNVLSRCDHIVCIVPDGCYRAQKLTPTLVNPAQVAKTDKDICAASLVLTLLEMQFTFALHFYFAAKCKFYSPPGSILPRPCWLWYISTHLSLCTGT